MAQAGYEWFEPLFASVLADGADQAGAHKTAAGPGAVAYKVNATLDGLQAVVADFQIQRAQVLANGFEPHQAGGAIWCQHHAVIHVPCVLRHLECALAKMVQAVEVDVGKRLAQQVANGHAVALACSTASGHSKHPRTCVTMSK